MQKNGKKKCLLAKVILSAFLICIIAFIGANVLFYQNSGKTLQECYEEAIEMAQEMDTDSFQMNRTTSIYYSDGTLMAELRKDASSHYLDYADIPEDAVNAFVAVEDRTFWENDGYDIKGILRAALSMVKEGEITQGGSTITQQLCKLVFLNNEKTVERKIKEIILAKEVTEKYGKEQIMEWYVNNCCFANNIYGLKDAAEAYFGKDVNELTLSETCYLCAIPNRPETYDPWDDPEAAIGRRDTILAAMLEVGMITEEEYASAIAEEIHVVTESPTGYNPDDETTYAVYCAAEILMEKEGFTFRNDFSSMDDYESYRESYREAYRTAEQELYTGGYTVYTSIEPEFQDALQQAIDQKLTSEESGEDGIYLLQGAATAIDNDTHKVVGIVGRRSQDGLDTVNYNRAYQFYRQPGSSIKPLVVYTPALMMGYSGDSILKNVDIQSAYTAYQQGVPVSVLSGRAYTLRNAVTWSRNGCAVYLYDEVTPDKGLQYLLDMGFSRIVPDDYYLSSGLGGLTYGTSTVEMASAYSAIANYGRFTAPTCIESMLDPEGNDLYEGSDALDVYSENAAIEITDIMEDVILSGTASGMNWSRASDLPAAGKTGTTNDNTNGWFCGYTAPYTIAVWVGRDDNAEVSGLTGSSSPAAIWKDAMLALTEGYEGDDGIFDGHINEENDGEESGVPGTWTVGGSGANVRDAASSSSNVLFALPAGTEVYVTARDEYWSTVVIDGATYYIYSPLLVQ